MTSLQKKEADQSNEAGPAGNQILFGVIVATAAFGLVLLLIAHAIRPSRPASDAEYGKPVPDAWAGTQPRRVHFELLTQQYRTNAAGIPELEITGQIRNAGSSRLQRAFLKCRFRTWEGADSFLEIPLINPTRLDDLDGGPLDAYSARVLGARVGNFPPGLRPEILDAKLVGISFSVY